MSVHGVFYEKKLYPFQDGVLNIVKKSELLFYLTGGTALSRGYLNHRYSDDLYFFVNNADDYSLLANTCIELLIEGQTAGKYSVDMQSVRRTESFSQIMLESNEYECHLKIDIVNDISFRVGDVAWHEGLGKIDSLQNILSNKLTALFRYEPKDVADIWCIAKNYSFSWKKVVEDAKMKDVGVEPMAIAEVLATFPEEMIDVIKWINKPERDGFLTDLKGFGMAILQGKDNRHL